MINILYSSISGRSVGGGQQSLLLLLTKIDRATFNPVLVCPDKGDFADAAKSLGIVTEVVATPKLAASNFSSIAKLVSIIRRYHISIVHADSARQVFYLGIAARITRTPLIWHIRVGDRGNRLYEELLYALSSRIIAVSHSAASRFGKSYLSNSKIRIIHNAVDITVFSPQVSGESVKNEFNISDKIIFGTMGQLLPRKGQDIFIHAAAETAARFKNRLIFMIVGTGTSQYASYLKKLAADHGLEASTIFTGFRSDIPRVMASFDVFVLATSYVEGLSRVIIEAMASGKPVIATDIGGNREAVIDGVNGKLIPPCDVTSLSNAMCTLASNELLRKQLGSKGRRLAQEKFDIKDNVASIEALYKELP
jgi:glycosyltransferase involved in cell wall biosynthesis